MHSSPANKSLPLQDQCPRKARDGKFRGGSKGGWDDFPLASVTGSHDLRSMLSNLNVVGQKASPLWETESGSTVCTKPGLGSVSALPWQNLPFQRWPWN